MKHTKISKILTVLFAVVLCFGPVGLAEPVGTSFTYQGRLIDANQAADGLYDFQFKLFNDETVGNQLWGDVNTPEVDVIDGYFTVELDFGGVFDGNERWLQIGVRPGELEDPNVYTTLSPRQEITPAPYALYAKNGGGAGGSPWQVNGSDIYYNNGNVGIGTTTPNLKLDVWNGGAGNAYIRSNKDDLGMGGFIISAGGFNQWFIMMPATGSDDLWFYNNSYPGLASIVIKDGSGNVGIGTENPTVKLEISGQVKITGGSPAAGKVLTSDSSGLANWQTLTETDPTVLASVKDGISWGEVSGIPAGFADGIDDVGAGDNLGNHTATQNIQLNGRWLSGDGGNEGVYVANDGSVGIGTSSPLYNLDVSGSGYVIQRLNTTSAVNGVQIIYSSASTNGFWSLGLRDDVATAAFALRDNSGNNVLVAKQGGNVGIGETNPSDKLTVGQGGNIVLKAAGEDAGDIIFQTDTGTQKGRMWGDPTAGQNRLYLSSADNNPDITIDPAGNVGIGTTIPTAKLEVNGNIKTAGIYETSVGDTWTPVESNRYWRSVAMSADGTKQTAVAGYVGSEQIYISTDSGSTWTPKESNRVWFSVAMSADGTKQTAVVLGGQIYISTDSGNNWTAKESNREWLSVAMSADGTTQTAVVQYGQIYVSTDSGNTWTAKESNRGWRSVAMSADGTKQTAVAAGWQIYVSTDSGNTWTAKESSRNWFSVDMSVDGTKQTAVVRYGQIYVSTDSGNTWTAKESNREWYSVAMSADGTKQTAVVYAGQIYVSTDSGNTWIAKESNRGWQAVAMSADGTKQTAVVYTGQIYISGIGVGIGTTAPARTLHINNTMRLQPRATAPSSPAEGDIYMNSSTHKLMVYTGTAWEACN